MTKPTPKRRWFRFSLRTLLVAMLLLGTGFGLLGLKLKNEYKYRNAIQSIRAQGGTVDFSPQGEYVYIGSNFSDATPLADLPNLNSLSLGARSTGLTDLTFLARLEPLVQLWIEDRPVGDLTPLAKLTNLKVLAIQNTQVADLTPLANLTGLMLLKLDGTTVSDEQVKQLQAALPNLTIGR